MPPPPFHICEIVLKISRTFEFRNIIIKFTCNPRKIKLCKIVRTLWIFLNECFFHIFLCCGTIWNASIKSFCTCGKTSTKERDQVLRNSIRR